MVQACLTEVARQLVMLPRPPSIFDHDGPLASIAPTSTVHLPKYGKKGKGPRKSWDGDIIVWNRCTGKQLRVSTTLQEAVTRPLYSSEEVVVLELKPVEGDPDAKPEINLYATRSEHAKGYKFWMRSFNLADLTMRDRITSKTGYMIWASVEPEYEPGVFG